MTIFVKLGGCNGSGKTSVVRSVIEQLKLEPLHDHNRKIEAYAASVDNVDFYVLGSYANTCGGMDSLPNKEKIRALFHKYTRRHGIVIGEGLIFGKTYGYIGERLVAEKRLLEDVKTLWAFMGTPFDECAERVVVRRLAAAALKGKEATPFDPERTMRLTYTIMERLEEGVRSGKYPINGEVMRLEYKPGRQPSTDAKKLLKKALEMYHAHG